jgi:hypothetical protein
LPSIQEVNQLFVFLLSGSVHDIFFYVVHALSNRVRPVEAVCFIRALLDADEHDTVNGSQTQS